MLALLFLPPGFPLELARLLALLLCLTRLLRVCWAGVVALALMGVACGGCAVAEKVEGRPVVAASWPAAAGPLRLCGVWLASPFEKLRLAVMGMLLLLLISGASLGLGLVALLVLLVLLLLLLLLLVVVERR